MSVRNLSAHILAAAVLDLFPQAHLIGGDHDGLVFSYDFAFPFEFQREFIPLIEEKMRQLAKQQDEVKIFEMVPSVAASFLTHHQQPGRAECALDHPDSLATIVQMGAFVDYSPFPVEAGPLFFKLDPDFTAHEGVIRLSGASFRTKEMLKNYLKCENPLELGRALDLFVVDDSGALLWLPRGEKLREVLIDWWKKEHEAQGFGIVHTSGFPEGAAAAHQAIFEANPSFARLAEIGESDCASFQGSQDTCISSLQFFVKILTIFGFKHRLILSKGRDPLLRKALKQCGLTAEGEGKRLEVRIQDQWEREWVGPTLELLEGGWIARSVFTSLEKWILHLIEQTAGNLPFWLAPEQVRICPLQHQDAEALKAQLSAHGIRVAVEASEKKLGEKIHDALRERIPYIIVLGEKEQKLKKVSVRAYGARAEELMDQETLIEKLVAERNIRL